KNITEDMELTFRLQKAGYKIETCLNSIVYTKTPETFKRLIRQRVRWYRGFIITSREYKEMFFNPKFGNLGVYTLPLYIVFVGLLFINISSLVYSIYRIVLDLYSIYFKTGIEIPEIDLRNLDSPILYTTVSNVFWLANIILYAYIFYLSLIMSKEKNFVKNLFSYLVQIFIYPFVLAYSWFLSIIKEILRAKTKWER
ncbi:MAG: glycosyltransferase family 2 protein, partial [Nanopusillaceae archaeon]